MRRSNLQSITTAVPRACAPASVERPASELHVVHPPELRTKFSLNTSKIVLGRQADVSSLVLLHEFVSRKHFELEWDATLGTHTGVDLGSSNGSWVDGIAATRKLALRDGSVLRIGPILMVYEAPERGPQPDVPPSETSEAIPGDAVATRQLRADVLREARHDSPILLCGATGTGKELIAREIHRASGRGGKLVAINCAALSPQLVESELFGHVRGAFTGAQLEQLGLFREAHGGTLLLDEIGELPLALQPKLLRVLQEKTVRPVGATRELCVDVRIVAATHRDLPEMVERGEFRRDLHARLCLSEIRVPSLQRRKPDVLAWLERLHVARCDARSQPSPARTPRGLDTQAAEAVLRRPWPDNLRGLARLAHALSDSTSDAGPCTLAELPSWFWLDPTPATQLDPTPIQLGKRRRQTPSRDELQALLQANGGSIRAVARHLERDRRQIYRWAEAFGLRETH
jgi:transcriptional regulator with GAF, ATPase, and Fis domain